MRAPLIALVAVACGGAQAKQAQAPDQVFDEDLVVTETGAGELAGTVIDTATGDKVSVAWVHIRAEGQDEPVAETVTDAAGAYRVKNLAPGNYVVSVRRGQLAAETKGVVILAGNTTELKHSLSSFDPADASERIGTSSSGGGSTGRIAGTVLDGARGDPFGGVMIEISSDVLGESIFAIAAEDGRFVVGSLRPAKYTLSVYYSLIDKGLVEIRRSGVEVRAGEETSLILELDTEPR